MGNIKNSYNDNKFQISPPTWNDEFELPDGSCSVSDIQDYFEWILEKHGEVVDEPSVQTYVSKIENRLHLILKMGIVLNFQHQRQ